MSHNFFERQLSAFADNELNERDAETMRMHVEACVECGRRLQIIRSIRASIREAATVELPASFAASVRHAIQQQEQEYVTWLGPERFARNFVVALCAVVLALVVVGNYLTPTPVVGEERYFSGEPSDSAAHAVIGSHRELSKDDVMIAALTK